MRGAVLAIRQRRALARLALAGRRLAAGHSLTVALELGQDELHRALDVPIDRRVDARLVGDREQVPDLLEEALARLREVVRVARQSLDGRLARLQHPTLCFGYRDRVGVGVDEILDLYEDGPAESVHESS